MYINYNIIVTNCNNYNFGSFLITFITYNPYVKAQTNCKILLLLPSSINNYTPEKISMSTNHPNHHYHPKHFSLILIRLELQISCSAPLFENHIITQITNLRINR